MLRRGEGGLSLPPPLPSKSKQPNSFARGCKDLAGPHSGGHVRRLACAYLFYLYYYYFFPPLSLAFSTTSFLVSYTRFASLDVPLTDSGKFIGVRSRHTLTISFNKPRFGAPFRRKGHRTVKPTVGVLRRGKFSILEAKVEVCNKTGSLMA